jgi:hypothetical protein
MIERLALLGVAIAVMIAILRPRYAFKVSVADGRAQLKSGEVPQRFVDEVSSILASNGVNKATVAGVRFAGHTRLQFSRGVPETCRQRVRNTWCTY